MTKIIKKAVLPVAGLGTRFLPATKAMAKEMLPVVDKPLIQYAVEEAFRAGIEQIIFVTGKGKNAIEDHFDRSVGLEKDLHDREKYELLDCIKDIVPKNGTVIYTRQHQPKGLGHAILCAKNIVGNEPFAVLLADDLIKTDSSVLCRMIEAYEKYQCTVISAMEVHANDVNKYGIINPKFVRKFPVEEQNLIPVFDLIEKPDIQSAPSNLAIVGRYILEPQIFNYLENVKRGTGNEIQLTDALKDFLINYQVLAHVFEGTRFDCGDKIGFQMANLAYALDRPDMREQLISYIKSLNL